jgi:hypothetical protein
MKARTAQGDWLWIGGHRFDSRQVEFFSLPPPCLDWLWGPSSLPSNGFTDLIPRGIKWPQCAGDHVHGYSNNNYLIMMMTVQHTLNMKKNVCIHRTLACWLRCHTKPTWWLPLILTRGPSWIFARNISWELSPSGVAAAQGMAAMACMLPQGQVTNLQILLSHKTFPL